MAGLAMDFVPGAEATFADAQPLLGRVALVTGSSEGIGAGIAVELARAGADVCVNYVGKGAAAAEDVARRVEEHGRRALVVEADVGERAAVEGLFEKVLGELGAVDIVVTNAVVSKRSNILDIDFADFERTLRVGVHGPFHCLQLGARQMLAAGKRGSFVHIGSPHVRWPCKDCIDYNTAKAGAEQLVLSAANELMWRGIRVNVVQPGWTHTPGEVRMFGEEYLAEVAAQMPLGRLAYPRDIAQAVLWLCSGDASFVTGSTLKVDGGAFIETGPSWTDPPSDMHPSSRHASKQAELQP